MTGAGPLTSVDIKGIAREHGFDACGITDPAGIGSAGEHLRVFLADGRHGGMAWLADHADRRAAPAVLWPDVRSIILLGHSYAPAANPLDRLGETDRGLISVYAKGRDYHDVIKRRLKLMAQEIARRSAAEVKVFVDTAPLMEKPLAAASGLGWQGKHTNLVSRTHGSWLFLGAILTTAELAIDAPHADHCGSCRRCLDVCPTNAFPAPYQLDARKCLAYLSIEHKEQIPHSFRAAMGNRVFGCDDCLAVCPWNRFAKASQEALYAAQIETDDPPIGELLAMNDATFRARFAGTPVKRTGRDRIVRNTLVAAGNSANRDYLPPIRQLIEDASPLVRGMAVWAFSRLAAPDEFAAMRQLHRDRELDADVVCEWDRMGSATRGPAAPI